MKKQLIYGLVFACILSMTGCSYKKMEDNLRQKAADTVLDIKKELNSDNLVSEEEKEGLMTDSNIHELGETVKIEWKFEDEKRSMTYCVNDVEVFSTIKDSELQSKDFCEGALYHEDIPQGKKLILASVHVENVNVSIPTSPAYEGEDEEELIYPFGMEIYAGSKDRVLDPNGPFADQACYFSEHPEDTERKYYCYYLEPGCAMDVQVGWLVDEEAMRDEYYYVLGWDYGIEPQFIYLRGEER